MPLQTTFKNSALDGAVSAHNTGSLYAALYVGDPAGAGSECSGTGYTRKLIAWNAASGGSKTNSSSIAWDNSGIAWSAGVSHVGIFDNATPGAGTLLATDDLTAVRDMSIPGATLTINAGSMTLSLT